LKHQSSPTAKSVCGSGARPSWTAYYAEITAVSEGISVVRANGAPELNPAEQVSQLLRDRNLANRCYDSYYDIINPCCEAWNKFTQIPDAVGSLCTRNRAKMAPVHAIL
jgi:hypothetical protein